MAERIAHLLGERLGDDVVAAHHGSLSKDRRLRVETRLRAGELRALVATASLELGIDIGPVELVCQIASPRSLATFLQRVGRSGHSRGGTPKGRLFPMTRDELVECCALLAGVRAGRLDAIGPPVAPLDILAQQIVAECAAERWREDDLYQLVRRAAPYADLSPGRLRRGRGAGVRRHRDRPGPAGRLRAPRRRQRRAVGPAGRPAGRPDLGRGDPRDRRLPGGGRPRRHLRGDGQRGLGHRVDGGRRVPARVHLVADPAGRAGHGPGGRRPGRATVGAVLAGRGAGPHRRAVRGGVRACGPASTPCWPRATPSRRSAGWRSGAGSTAEVAAMVVRYLAAARAALGRLPTLDHIVFERFFDDTGGMQLIVHAPFGGRINRAFGLALRKRFCVSFDFELQAAASDDAVLLSLGPQHSFPLESVSHFLSSATVEQVLRQAALASPMFAVRWRWNLNRALAVLRFKGGRKNPAPHPADGGRRPDGGGVPGPGRLPGKRHRPDRDPRPPAGPPDDARLPDTRPWTSPACASWCRRWSPGRWR